jgi:hypothetical protein
VSDNVGVIKVEHRLLNPEGVAVVSGDTGRRSGTWQNGVYVINLQTALTAKGVYKVQFRATDGAGNITQWTQIGTFTVTPTRATLSSPDYTNNNVAARYTSSLAPQTIFGTITTSKSLGNSPCSNPCSGLVAGESITISRRIQTATNPGSVTFLVTNPSRGATDQVVATLTSGTSLDGIWTATWIVSQTITDNPWTANTQLLWGAEYATS